MELESCISSSIYTCKPVLVSLIPLDVWRAVICFIAEKGIPTKLDTSDPTWNSSTTFRGHWTFLYWLYRRTSRLQVIHFVESLKTQSHVEFEQSTSCITRSSQFTRYMNAFIYRQILPVNCKTEVWQKVHNVSNSWQVKNHKRNACKIFCTFINLETSYPTSHKFSR